MRRTIVMIVVLLFSTKLSATYGSSECNPSRCGNQYIGYPFTLKGDPSNCSGDEKYRLSCVGNKTFMAAPFDKYLVLSIFYNNYTINIVDTYLASGKCNLPSQAITPRFIQPVTFGEVAIRVLYLDENPDPFYLTEVFGWFSFINCSEKIESNSHRAIPCLSQNNRFIYVVDSSNIDSLALSCSYLTMLPITSPDVNVHGLSNIGDDIFRIMKHGFSLSWASGKRSRSEIIHRCLGEAVPQAKEDMVELKRIEWIKFPFQIEYEFLFCIQKANDLALYRYFIVLVVFLDIISFYLVIITFGRLIIAPLCIHIFLLYELLKMLSPIDYIENFLRSQQQTTLTRYVYTDLVAMTKHFKYRLGQGGFGTVYKGELPGDCLVAVKLLGTSNDNGEDFISEVSTIGTIHHTNVVRLIGFCSEGLHRALVYEYMYNGSLDKYIFSSTRKFTSNKLNEIAIGVARGIDYLHRGCDMRILHFDIKPHNILLDDNFNPKVSDFGLAKLYSKDNSLVSTFAARGTIGYMAPELISRSFGPISYKSDVYSFGMLLLEMASGRRNYDSQMENLSEAYYPSWIYDRLDKQTNLEMFNHNVEIVDVEKKLCKVGLWCIQMSPSSRPTMLRVIEMLEGDVEDVEMPPKPFFFSSSDGTTRRQNSAQMSSTEISTIYESE